jgi:L-asparagine transporter-like permease
MSEQAIEPGVVEGGHLQKSPKTWRKTMVSIGDVIEAGLFIGGSQVCSHRRHVTGSSVPSNRHR